MYNNFGLTGMKRTSITLQFADKSTGKPEGILEDVLVKVGSFVIPADFIIYDIEDNKGTQLILGRSFLKTGRALIDVAEGQLTLRVEDKEAIFYMD